MIPPYTSGLFKPINPLEVVFVSSGSGFILPPNAKLSASVNAPDYEVTSFTSSVASCCVIDGGTGYTAKPNISFDGGGGSGATADAIVAGNIVSISGYESYNEYKAPPNIVSSGVGFDLEAVCIMSGFISGVDIACGGTGYTVAPELIVNGKSERGAILRAKMAGYLYRIDIIHPGYYPLGFTPTITISGASASAIMSPPDKFNMCKVSEINIINGGLYYDCPPPAITISSSSFAGSVVARATGILNCGISGVEIISGGAGYTQNPTITVKRIEQNIDYNNYYSYTMDTVTVTPTTTTSPTVSFSPTSSPTVSFSPTSTVTRTLNETPQPTRSSTITPSPTKSSAITLNTSIVTPTPTPSPTCTKTPTPSRTSTCTPSYTPTTTCTSSHTPTNTCTPSYSPTVTCTPSYSPTNSPTWSLTPSRKKQIPTLPIFDAKLIPRMNYGIKNIEILDGGRYRTSPTLYVEPAKVSNNKTIMISAGSGFTSIPHIHHYGSCISTPYRNYSEPSGFYPVLNFKIDSVDILNSGTNYSIAPRIELMGGYDPIKGTRARLSANIANGNVNRINIDDAGNMYLTSPDIKIYGGDSTGYGLQIRVNIKASIEDIFIENIGYNLTENSPNNRLIISGNGDNCKHKISIENDISANTNKSLLHEINYKIIGVNITSGGENYEYSPSVNITGGNPKTFNNIAPQNADIQSRIILSVQIPTPTPTPPPPPPPPTVPPTPPPSTPTIPEPTPPPTQTATPNSGTAGGTSRLDGGINGLSINNFRILNNQINQIKTNSKQECLKNNDYDYRLYGVGPGRKSTQLRNVYYEKPLVVHASHYPLGIKTHLNFAGFSISNNVFKYANLDDAISNLSWKTLLTGNASWTPHIENKIRFSKLPGSAGINIVADRRLFFSSFSNYRFGVNTTFNSSTNNILDALRVSGRGKIVGFAHIPNIQGIIRNAPAVPPQNSASIYATYIMDYFDTLPVLCIKDDLGPDDCHDIQINTNISDGLTYLIAPTPTPPAPSTSTGTNPIEKAYSVSLAPTGQIVYGPFCTSLSLGGLCDIEFSTRAGLYCKTAGVPKSWNNPPVLTTIIESGRVKDVTVTNAGKGFINRNYSLDVWPKNTLSYPPSSWSEQQRKSYDIVSEIPGIPILFNGGGGYGAAAVAIVSGTFNNDGRNSPTGDFAIASVIILASGDGYTSPPEAIIIDHNETWKDYRTNHDNYLPRNGKSPTEDTKKSLLDTAFIYKDFIVEESSWVDSEVKSIEANSTYPPVYTGIMNISDINIDTNYDIAYSQGWWYTGESTTGLHALHYHYNNGIVDDIFFDFFKPSSIPFGHPDTIEHYDTIPTFSINNDLHINVPINVNIYIPTWYDIISSNKIPYRR